MCIIFLFIDENEIDNSFKLQQFTWSHLFPIGLSRIPYAFTNFGFAFQELLYHGQFHTQHS